MSTNDITAPGRSALWTEAALRALGGLAATDAEYVNHWIGDKGKQACIVEDGVAMAMMYATAFEQACIKQHAEEQVAAKAERERQIAEWTATVRRVGRYVTHPENVVLVVDRIEGSHVHFCPDPRVLNGRPVFDNISSVATGENGWTPAPVEPTP